MFYQQELAFLRDTLHGNHVQTNVLPRQTLPECLAEENPEGFFSIKNLLEELLPTLLPNTVYHLTGALELRFRLLPLPKTEPPSVLLIGPYRTVSLPPQRLLELGEKGGVPPKQQRYFTEYYESIPILGDDHPLWIMLHVFCERIFDSSSFSIREISHLPTPSEPAIKGALLSSPADDIMVNMKAMEQRYAFENEMIRAVEKGLAYMEDRLLSAFSSRSFEKRAADPLRNAKNYGIIMNTLLRKAAERGGVHPLYLDRMSSDFAAKVEAMPSLSRNTELMCEMFRSYCRLVREHSMRDLPPVVQQAILLIDADLSADLAPSRLAKTLGVSLGYLSTVFKRATGETISEYVRRRRMDYAAYLLSTTGLQIQTVALHCGILDVQYFSKLFKNHLRLTPTQYRQAHRGAPRA